MGVRRRLVVCALALALLVSVSGCSVVGTLGSAVDKGLLSAGLDELVVDLEHIPGITGATETMAIQPDMTYSVHVEATTDGLAQSDAVEALALVTQTFTSGRFVDQPSLAFSIVDNADAQPLITIAQWVGFPTDTLPAEVDYLYALQDAFGSALSLQLFLVESGQVFRSISARDESGVVNWDALRAVADPSTSVKSWNFGTVQLAGSLLPSTLDGFAASLNEPSIPGFASLSWSSVSASFDLFFLPSEFAVAGNFSSLPEWERIVSLATTAVTDPRFRQLTIAEDGTNVSAHVGQCASTINDHDTVLAQQLAEAGVSLNPGICMP